MTLHHISTPTKEISMELAGNFRAFHFARLKQSVSALQGNWIARVTEAEKLPHPIAMLETLQGLLETQLPFAYAGVSKYSPLHVEEALSGLKICIAAMEELERV